MKLVLGLIALIVGIGGIVAYLSFSPQSSKTDQLTNTDEDRFIIGLSMGTLRSERWVQDRDHFVTRAKELGAEVIVFSANEEPEEQNRQAENLILQGVDVLVVIAEDTQKSSVIIDIAHQTGVPVIAYDRLIQNPALDYYVSFDNTKVGEPQAQEVLKVIPEGEFAYVGGSPTDNNAFLVKHGTMNILQPLIDSGAVTLVYDEFTDDWKQEVAYREFKSFLATHGGVDAVIAANDSTAAGVIQALEEVDLAGTVPISGQDAALAAVQNIVAGKQTVTIYKPIKDLAYKAAEMAVALAKEEPFPVNAHTEVNESQIPTFLLDVVPVTKDNIDETVIKDGFHKKEEVYLQP